MDKTVKFVLALGGYAKTTQSCLGLKTVCSNQSDPSKFRAARQTKPAGREPTASLPENPAWFLIAGSANRAGYGEINKG
jgi:hypothetical protein